MWQRQNTLRGFLFCVFFLIGVLVLVESILCEELLVYLKNSQAAEEAESGDDGTGSEGGGHDGHRKPHGAKAGNALRRPAAEGGFRAFLD